jgi:hypothetical protein
MDNEGLRMQNPWLGTLTRYRLAKPESAGASVRALSVSCMIGQLKQRLDTGIERAHYAQGNHGSDRIVDPEPVARPYPLPPTRKAGQSFSFRRIRLDLSGLS